MLSCSQFGIERSANVDIILGDGIMCSGNNGKAMVHLRVLVLAPFSSLGWCSNGDGFAVTRPPHLRRLYGSSVLTSTGFFP